MEKLISKIKDWMKDSFRRFYAPVSPGTRMLAVVIVAVVFAVANFYILFRAIYNIGREDKKWERIDSKIRIPEMEPEAPQGKKEKFFYKPFNSKQNDTATKG